MSCAKNTGVVALSAATHRPQERSFSVSGSLGSQWHTGWAHSASEKTSLAANAREYTRMEDTSSFHYSEDLSRSWLILPLLLLYLLDLGGVVFLSKDEPRYASIGREMARSGDLVTPRLNGAAWFEKPPLLYW